MYVAKIKDKIHLTSGTVNKEQSFQELLSDMAVLCSVMTS